MESQINIENQNSRQISQNPLNQPQVSPVFEKPKLNYWMILSAVLALVLVGVVGYCFTVLKKNTQTTAGNLMPMPTPVMDKTRQMDAPILSQKIIFPFVRNGNIYIYDDGKEILLVSPAQKSTENKCYNLIYPFISPDKKFIAYIEQTGDAPEYGGCLSGILKLVNVSTRTISSTNYKTSYFSWNDRSQLQFEVVSYKPAPDNQGIDPTRSTVKFIIFDPSSQREVVSETMKYSDRDKGIRGFPLYRTEKRIRFKNNNFYLVNNNTEIYLFNHNTVRDFRGFSPNGEYAMFVSKRQAPENNQPFGGIWYAVNTNNPSEVKKDIFVLSGAAGGDFSTGLKWLFNKAFISYCSQHLSFIDGSQPLELTNDGGGGCHNEEGFVSTSPDGNNALIKFKDRFELWNKDGGIIKVAEKTPVTKGRGAPKNMIWLDNNNVIIFQSAYGGGNSYTEPPSIYIFEKKSNTISPLVQNGYLIESP